MGLLVLRRSARVVERTDLSCESVRQVYSRQPRALVSPFKAAQSQELCPGWRVARAVVTIASSRGLMSDAPSKMALGHPIHPIPEIPAETPKSSSKSRLSPSQATMCARKNQRRGDDLQDTFNMRELPNQCVAFSSETGREIFKECMMDGLLDGSYFTLAEQFKTQDEPAYCGLATLAMALNALNVDPAKVWKGPWRWWSEEMVECCTAISLLEKRGMLFDEFVCAAKCNSATVDAVRADTEDFSVAKLRAALERVSRPQPEGKQAFLIASYDRRTLGQTGSGHYSPIAAYNKKRDVALIMDVARFKYPPHWVPVSTLADAMRTKDPDTDRARGYTILS